MPQAICPLTSIWTFPQPLQYVFLPRNWMTNGRGTNRNIERAGIDLHDRERPSVQSVAANARCGTFDLLRPHLATVEMVRETVLGEAGTALPTDGCGNLALRLHAPDCTPTCTHAGETIVRCATVGHLVPIANISRREDDGTCSPRERFHLPRPAGSGEGRQLWKRWCAHPTVSCPHCRRTIMN